MTDSTTPPGMEKKTPEPPKKGGGLGSGFFGGKPKQDQGDLKKNVADLAGELNNISRRLMILEERYTNLRKKTQLTDQNMLNNNKKVMTEVHTTNSMLEDSNKALSNMKDKLKIMVRELKDCAKRQEVQVLQKYINIWEPINFVTKNAVTRIVSDEVETQINDLHIRLQEEDYIKHQIKIALNELKDKGHLNQ